MLKKYNRVMITILATLDVALTLLAVLVAYYIRFKWEPFIELFPIVHGIPPFEDFLNPYVVVIIAIIWLVIFRFSGLYKTKRGKSNIDEAFSVFNSVLLSTIILLGISFFYRKTEYSRIVVVLFLLLDNLFIISARLSVRHFLRYLRSRGFNLRHVIIAGAGRLGRALAEKINLHPALGLNIIGFVDDNPRLHGEKVLGYPVLGSIDDLPDILSERGIDLIFVTLPLTAHRRTAQLLNMLQKEIVDVRVVPDLLQYITIRAGVEDLDGLPIINLSETPLDTWNALTKRLLDLTICLVLLVPLTLLMGVIAIAIKLTSKGKVFYKQERMGLDGKSFIMYKFRTMVEGAEDETGPVFAKPNDPRCTTIGKILRRSSLDEIPQIFNVLKGDMSLVGPRPERPPFVMEFREKIPRYMLRHKVKSGVTGWAQINGLRGDTSIEKRIEFDMYYIQNWSIGFDLKILLLTIFRAYNGAA